MYEYVYSLLILYYYLRHKIHFNSLNNTIKIRREKLKKNKISEMLTFILHI